MIVADVYAAGENAIEGFNKETLAAGISDYGHKNVSLLKSEDDLCEKIYELANPNDVVIFLGAGNITKWSDNIISNIDKYRGKKC